jgi:hypothetical protein
MRKNLKLFAPQFLFVQIPKFGKIEFDKIFGLYRQANTFQQALFIIG